MNGFCSHIGWLTFVDERDTVLWDHGRLSRILLELTNPDVQRPAIVSYLGRKVKNHALRALYPGNNFGRASADGLISLTADNLTLQTQHPVLIAQSDPALGQSLPNNHASTACHEATPHPVHWTLPTGQTVFDIVHARLFCLFVDVLCVFADDFRDFEDVVCLLQTWATLGRATDDFDMARPRVIIVKQGADPGPSATYDLLRSEELRQRLSQADLARMFSAITVLYLADEQISSLARYRRLKEVVQRQTEEMRHAKETMGCHFSARHLNHFFEDALDHTARTIASPFDFIFSSRRSNPVSHEQGQHLSEFLRLCQDQQLSYRFSTTVIASTIILNAYPPGMHLFDPEIVFDRLYRSTCMAALSASGKENTMQHQCQMIRDKVVDSFVTMQRLLCTAVEVHRSNLDRSHAVWMQLRSNRTCLTCLMHKPEDNTLSCGHSLCDTCVRIFSRAVSEGEYSYVIDRCMLCSLGSLKVDLKPPTAGVRVLSIDGGGVRGVIPLEFLSILQQVVGVQCPVQDLFDLAFGTSSGGLIVLGLFLRQWGVAHCITTFDKLTREFFNGRLRPGAGVWFYLRRLLSCWLSDGYYNVVGLEQTLRQQFGGYRRVFGSSCSAVNTKVAVIATTISDAMPVVISNYNGRGVRHSDCGYNHTRPRNIDDEPCIWEACVDLSVSNLSNELISSRCRATSAAPMLFQPVQISSLGSFQDGGLKHNNPVNLALWECAKIWPSSCQPDVVMSLGTGTNVNDVESSPTAATFRHIIHDGFLPRLWRSFMSSLDGQSTWRELWNRLDDTSKMYYFRANIYLPDDALMIDDIGGMDLLRDRVHSQPDNDRLCGLAAFVLLTACLFFELTSPPFFQNNKIYCKGVIRCRLRGKTFVTTMSRIHPPDLEYLVENEVVGYYMGMEDLCPVCGRYQKEIEFSIRHIGEQITISLSGVTFGKRRISGFPHSMQWFKDQQYMEAYFGKPVHESTRTCEGCELQGPHPLSLLPKRKGGPHHAQDTIVRKRFRR